MRHGLWVAVGILATACGRVTTLAPFTSLQDRSSATLEPPFPASHASSRPNFICEAHFDEAAQRVVYYAEGQAPAIDGEPMPADEDHFQLVTAPRDPEGFVAKCRDGGATITLEVHPARFDAFDPHAVSIAAGLELTLRGPELQREHEYLELLIERASDQAVVATWGSWQGFPIHLALNAAAPGEGYALRARRGTLLHMGRGEDGTELAYSTVAVAAPTALTFVP